MKKQTEKQMSGGQKDFVQFGELNFCFSLLKKNIPQRVDLVKEIKKI